MGQYHTIRIDKNSSTFIRTEGTIDVQVISSQGLSFQYPHRVNTIFALALGACYSVLVENL